MHVPFDHRYVQMLRREREDEARRHRLAVASQANARSERSARKAARKANRAIPPTRAPKPITTRLVPRLTTRRGA